MKKMLLAGVLLSLVSVSAIASAQYTMTQTTVAMPAQQQNLVNTDSKMAIWVDPDSYNSNISYDLTALGLTNYLATNKPSILKIRCDGKDILKALGISNAKVVSVGIQEADFTYTYDFNNCSMYWGKVVYAQATDAITEADAIKMAKDFVAKSEALSYFKTMIGEPVVTYKNNYDLAWIAREGKYYSMSIVFPMKITGKSVYQMYGDPVGLMVEVNNKGVASVNTSLLPFKLQKADSVKLSTGEFTGLVSRGGNNPYYPGYMPGVDTSTLKETVKLLSYDKIWVLTYKYPPMGGMPAIYLTSGIRIKSDKKVDFGPNTDKRDYTMVVSDYRIGNNAQPMPYYK